MQKIQILDLQKLFSQKINLLKVNIMLFLLLLQGLLKIVCHKHKYLLLYNWAYETFEILKFLYSGLLGTYPVLSVCTYYQWCNLTLARQFWVSKMCLRVSKILKICLFGCLAGRATS